MFKNLLKSNTRMLGNILTGIRRVLERIGSLFVITVILFAGYMSFLQPAKTSTYFAFNIHERVRNGFTNLGSRIRNFLNK
jgi:hypothetical protein